MINNTTYRMVIYYLFIQFSLFYTAGLACSVIAKLLSKGAQQFNKSFYG